MTDKSTDKGIKIVDLINGNTIHTKEVKESLQSTSSFSSFYKNNKENMLDSDLSSFLTYLLEHKNITRAKAIRNSGLDEAYGYQIFSGQKRPSRDKLICLCFGMKMTEDEIQRTLKIAGCSELYVRIPRDAALLYAIQRGFTVEDTEALLEEHGFPSLYGKDM